MKAATYRRYGPPSVISIEEIPTPVPEKDEVLIEVRASTVSSADCRVRGLQLPPGFGPFAHPAFGVFGPRQPILGTELSGVITAIGSAVTRFRVGDAVFAFPGSSMGSHAANRAMAEDAAIAPLPAGATFEEAAALSFGGTTALHFLHDVARVRPREDVLIIGASGAVGSAAVQIAKAFDANVTGVTSTRNLDLVGSLGADEVVDYTRTSYLDGERTYDVILDAVGVTSLRACRQALKENGRLFLAAAGVGQILGSYLAAIRSKRRVAAGPAPDRVEHVLVLKEMFEAGRFRPLVDRTYPFEQIAQAHTYVETGRKRGSVVITMVPPLVSPP